MGRAEVPHAHRSQEAGGQGGRPQDESFRAREREPRWESTPRSPEALPEGSRVGPAPCLHLAPYQKAARKDAPLCTLGFTLYTKLRLALKAFLGTAKESMH